MKVSPTEKLTLLMLAEIYEHLGIKGEIDAKFVKAALTSGNLWALEWQLGGLLQDSEPSPDVIRETVKLMEMWDRLEVSFNRLSTQDQQRVAKEAPLHGSQVKFLGFDGNHEPHFHVARFLIKELGRFGSFTDRRLNAHIPTLDRHRRMFEIYDPIRDKVVEKDLDVSQIISVLNA